jgi:uncharacterized protein (DUF488 family)
MVLVLTTGHSTRPIETFLAMLRDARVEHLADVRTIPRSRHNPQYESEALAASLAGAGITYEHMPALGGLRRAKKDSVSLGWRNLSFRGFADYMRTPEFDAALDTLISRAGARRTAIMCSEGAPFRCHRSLVADALLACGHDAEEIGTHGHLRPHRMTPFAVVRDGHVTYPAPEPNGD